MPHGSGDGRSRSGGQESTVRAELLSEAEWDSPTVRTAPPWCTEEQPALRRENEPGQALPVGQPEDACQEPENEKTVETTRFDGRLPSESGEEQTTPIFRSELRLRAGVLVRALGPDEDWWVKSANSLVGPVTTTLLLAGIAAGRVPASCEVLSMHERIWRPIQSIQTFADAFSALVEAEASSD